MALFVHLTSECQNECHTHQREEALDKIIEKIEASQKLSGFDPFPANYHVKKQFGGRNGRLIGRLELITVRKPSGESETHSILVLLSFMTRGNPDYAGNFSKNPKEYGEQHFDHLYTSRSLTEWAEKRLAVNPPHEKPAPTIQEYGYLHQALQQKASATAGDTEDTVFESREWFERCRTRPYKEWLPNIYQALWAENWPETPNGGIIPVPNKPGWAILVRYLPTHRVLFLVAPVILNEEAALAEIRARYASVVGEQEPELNTILSHSRQAYPAEVLQDDDLWLQIEKDDTGEANMALSPEELGLLESARKAGGGYPLFINGRAGSGKTTILQYLFADYLYYHLTAGDLPNPPVYFTCNSELLRRSHQMVTRLLRCHAKWAEHRNRDEFVEQRLTEIDAAFREFHEHLLSLVPLSERGQRFTLAKYVNFARFKQLWENNFSRDPAARGAFGPDISWHVIRSYIKGLSSEEFIDPEEYQQLPTNQITVTQGTYETVHDKVWVRWYQKLCEDEGYWDDQDLARFLIERDLVRAVHPAIFCDESQDFTRIELEVILRLSLFSERKISREDVGFVPFVFAGDEFQTLNPTGFRWDTVKAFFVEKFIVGLAQQPPKSIDLNYQELTFNYRSSRSIVKFSNLIQALRARLFELPGLKPQDPWEHEQHPPPVTRFQAEDAKFWEKLKGEIDIALIVPCGEGEEVSFIENDDVLRERVKVIDGVPQMLVLSANRAKGLEFPRVVVYGFGKIAPTGILDPVQGKDAYAGDPDRSLPYQYFINRLYVSVSRPRRRLFVVDSKNSLSSFWTFAHDMAQMKGLLEKMKHGIETWGASVMLMEVGDSEDLSLDRAADPLENAKILERDGRARRDAYMLEQAAVSFSNAGQASDATRCTAEARRIQCKFIEAGDLYLLCQNSQEAVLCYWEDGRDGGRDGWKKLVKSAAQHPEVTSTPEYKLATGLIEKLTITIATGLVQMLVDRLSGDDTYLKLISSSAWIAAVRALFEAILKLESTGPADWMVLAQMATRLADAGFAISLSIRGMLYYRAQDLGRAAELWNQCQPHERSSNEYRIARAYSAPYPDRLNALSELGKMDDIIVAYDSNSGVKLNRDQTNIVGRALAARGDYDRALPKLIEALDVQGLTETVAQTYVSDSETAEKAAKASFGVIVANGKLSDLLPYLDGRALPFTRRISDDLQAWAAWRQKDFDLELMRALARSDSLADLKWDARSEPVKQRSFADFLRKRLFSNERPVVERDDLIALGAAVERAGDRLFALVYYKRISEDSSLPLDSRQHAIERWVACKERQARFMESDGDVKRAKKAREEAQEGRTRAGMKSDDRISEYPELSTLADYLLTILTISPTSKQTAPPHQLNSQETTSAEVVSPAVTATNPTPSAKETSQPQRGTICGRAFEFHRQDGRLNLSSENGVVLNIRPKKSLCTSADLTVVTDTQNPKRFNVEEWKLVVNFMEPNLLMLEFLDEKLELRFKLD